MYTKIYNRNVKRFLKKFINRFIKLDNSKNIVNHKFPDIDMMYVTRLYENLALQNHKFRKIKVRKIDDRILEIKKL